MIELNLKRIILNVDFSPIEIGQSEREIIRILGIPTGRLNGETGSTILSYGGYEFGLWDNELHYFQNDNLKYQYLNHSDWILFENKNFKINTWFIAPNKDISMKEVILLLEKEQVDFNIQNQKVGGKDYKVGEVKYLQLSNGVYMYFENNTIDLKLSKTGKVLKETKVICENEMDFVLNSIGFDQFRIE